MKTVTFHGNSIATNFRPKKLAIRGLKHLGQAIKDLSIIGPVVQLIFTLTGESIMRKHVLLKTDHKLSLQAQSRLTEMEKRVQDIAKRAGIAHSHRFKVFIGPPALPMYAFGKFSLVIPSEMLLRPEDLPEDLSIDKIDQKVMRKGEWTHRCINWLNQSFAPQKEASRDERMLYLLHLHVKHSDRFREQDDAVIAHELGHCALEHTKRKAWQRFAWQMLAIPTLGISTLFEKRVMQRVSVKYEKEADLFSAKKANGAEGLLTYFSILLFIGQVYHQENYKGYDAKGNYTKKRTHPLITTRCNYLRKLAKNNLSDSRQQAIRFYDSLNEIEKIVKS